MDIQISNVDEPGIFVYGDIDFEMLFKMTKIEYLNYGTAFKVEIECEELEGEEDGQDTEAAEDCGSLQLGLFTGTPGVEGEGTLPFFDDLGNRR